MSLRTPSFPTTRDTDASIAGIARAKAISANSAIVERALFWVFIGGLAWCPFWFGSHALLAWGINAVLFPGLVAIYELLLLIRGERHPVAIWQIQAPAALFGAVVLWILFQNATWTPAWLHHPVWQMAGDALDQPINGSISVDRELTRLALLRLITSASVFWMALQLCREAPRAKILLRSVAAIAFGYAAYGLVAHWLWPGRILWFEDPYNDKWVHATFINANSFATYVGIGFVAFCALLLKLYRNEFASVGGSIRFRIATFIEVTGRKGMALLGAAFVVLVALLLSGSRGAISATVLALLVLVALSLRPRKNTFAEQREAIIAIGVLFVAATFLAFGDVVVGKIAQQGFSGESRLAVQTITIRSILDAPALGYGYGTFSDVFPMFRDQSLGTAEAWQMGHNTYLEVLQGLGLVFGSMLVACVGLLVWRCVKGAAVRQRDETLPCVAASAAVLLGLHSLVDFSLQIQAITLMFMALLGAGVAQSESSRVLLAD